nr:HEAT repeat domain-containing protein [uncultured Methanoregula sp.]
MVSKNKKKAKVPLHDNAGQSQTEIMGTSAKLQEKTVEQLIRELRDPDEIVRSTAAGTLGHRKSEKATKPLILALNDPHVYVRHGAAWALGEIKSESAVDALRQALNDEDEITRGKAAEALGKIQGF